MAETPGVIVVSLAGLLVCSSVIALIAMAIAFVTYMVLKSLNVEDAAIFAAVTGISMPISAIALLFLKYLQFLTGYLAYAEQIP